MINVLGFEARNLDKKNWKDLDISYIGYVDKNPDWGVNSVNPLYSLINKVHGNVSEKDGVKYLTIEKADTVLKKLNQVFSGIKHHLKKIVVKKFYMIVNLIK